MSAGEEDEQDLTRKQRREQARSQRKELEQAEAATAVRRARVRQLGIVVAIVVAIIVVILIATGGGGSGSKNATTKPSPQVPAEVTPLLAAIPQSGNTLGNPKAPVTLAYFGDLECPICKEFTLGALTPIVQKWVRGGQLKIEYRALETATKEPGTFKTQQVAALAAGKQNKMWYYLELFYHEQGQENSGYVTESYLQGLAQQVPGLNLAAWTAARNDPQLTNMMVSDAQAAANAGLSGTPSFQIGKTGGNLRKLEYASLKDPSSFNTGIETVLKS